MAKISRGNSVFKRIGRSPVEKGFSRGFGPPGSVDANDLFLYALFARFTLVNNETIEFETKFDQRTNTIELKIPPEMYPLLDKLTGIKQGPDFKRYIAWLVGNAGGGGGGGGVTPVTNTLTTFDNTPQVIAVIPLTDDTTYLVNVDVTARRTDALGHGGFIRRALVWREGGSPATMEGVVDDTFTRRQPTSRNGIDTTIDVVGNNAIIEVVGKIGHTINWQSQYTFNAST